jgi:hypothetical protein
MKVHGYRRSDMTAMSSFGMVARIDKRHFLSIRMRLCVVLLRVQACANPQEETP